MKLVVVSKVTQHYTYGSCIFTVRSLCFECYICTYIRKDREKYKKTMLTDLLCSRHHPWCEIYKRGTWSVLSFVVYVYVSNVPCLFSFTIIL